MDTWLSEILRTEPTPVQRAAIAVYERRDGDWSDVSGLWRLVSAGWVVQQGGEWHAVMPKGRERAARLVRSTEAIYDRGAHFVN